MNTTPTYNCCSQCCDIITKLRYKYFKEINIQISTRVHQPLPLLKSRPELCAISSWASAYVKSVISLCCRLASSAINGCRNIYRLFEPNRILNRTHMHAHTYANSRLLLMGEFLPCYPRHRPGFPKVTREIFGDCQVEVFYKPDRCPSWCKTNSVKALTAK